MRALDLAIKDLLQVVRDWKSALFLLIMPLAFTVFFGLMFSGAEAPQDTRWPVGIVDQDEGGTLGPALVALVEGSEALRPVALTGSRGERVDELVRSGELVAAVIVPRGFSDRLLAGESPQMTLIVDQGSSGGHAASTALQGLTVRLLGAVQAAELSAQAAEAQGQLADEAARRAYLEQGVALAQQAWQHPPLAVAVNAAVGTASGAGQPSAEAQNPFTQSSPGMIIQFVVAGLISPAIVLVLERKSRALQRLLTTPISRAEVIGGHVLATFAVVVFQQALLVGAGQLLFGVDYLREPLATLLMIGAFALFAASLGLFIGVIAKTDEQVVMWSLVAMFILTPLAGAWFPLAETGRVFSIIGHLTPTAWAMDGFQNIIVRGLGLSSVGLPVAILVGYAALFFALALWRFRSE